MRTPPATATRCATPNLPSWWLASASSGCGQWGADWIDVLGLGGEHETRPRLGADAVEALIRAGPDHPAEAPSRQGFRGEEPLPRLAARTVPFGGGASPLGATRRSGYHHLDTRAVTRWAGSRGRGPAAWEPPRKGSSLPLSPRPNAAAPLPRSPLHGAADIDDSVVGRDTRGMTTMNMIIERPPDQSRPASHRPRDGSGMRVIA